MLPQQSTIMTHKVFENAESIKTQVISRFLTKTKEDIKIESGVLDSKLSYHIINNNVLFIAPHSFNFFKDSRKKKNYLRLENNSGKYKLTIFFDSLMLAGKALSYLKEYVPKNGIIDNTEHCHSFNGFKLLISRFRDVTKYLPLVQHNSYKKLNNYSCPYNTVKGEKNCALFIDKSEAEKASTDLNKLLKKYSIKAKTMVAGEGSYFVLELPVINLQKLY